MALLLGLGNLILCGLYIWFSGKLASALARDKATLSHIEMWKGLIFVAISTRVFVTFVYLLLKRVSTTEKELKRQREILEIFQQKASSGLLASSIAHDINNMLMVLQARALRLTDMSPELPPAADSELAELQKNLDDLISLAQSLQNSARAATPTDLRQVDLAALLEETVRQARQHPRAKSAEIETTITEPLYLQGYPLVLKQMMLNLLLNALDATYQRPGGKIRVELSRLPTEKLALLEFHDNGPGVPEQERELIFSPYYTTKLTGTGLGLLSVKAGVKAHNGNISVHASPLGGAAFRVTLPL
jgi:signal transduction histidine kinase